MLLQCTGPQQTNITYSNLRATSRSSITSANAVFPNRRFRPYNAANVNDEDKNEKRIGISDLAKITEKLTDRLWLKLGKNPKDVFTKLHLAEAGVKLDDNPVFIRWLQYVNQYEEKKGPNAFSEAKIFLFLQQSKPENELVTVFQTLTQVPDMKNLADTMLWITFMNSQSSHKLMYEVWLKNQETPKEVFKILGLQGARLDVDNTAFLGWLRYTELYRAKMGVNSFSELHTMHLLEATPLMNDAKFGTVFQLIKELSDLKKLAESMQTHLFVKWIQVKKANPQEFGDTIAMPNGSWKSILKMPKNNAYFQTLEAYTLKYAEYIHRPTVLKKVKGLFSNNDPEAAVAAAMKASY